MSISAKARLAGVMGWPVGHSLSPRLHGFWLDQNGIDGAYVPLAVRPEDAAQAIAMLPRMGFRGLNVTVPHKETALNAVDSVDDLARRVGAVNTITFDENGKSRGTNTDGFGFIENIRQTLPDIDFTTGPATVLGAGGAARAIAVALCDAGVPEVRIINRTTERAQALVNDIGGALCAVAWDERENALGDSVLVANTTTLGMVGQPPLEISLENLPVGACVTDIVYAPLMTPLLQAAEQRGNPIVDGIGMLLHQARPGFEAWFDCAPSVSGELRAHVLGGMG